jgi:hypothetical protein
MLRGRGTSLLEITTCNVITHRYLSHCSQSEREKTGEETANEGRRIKEKFCCWAVRVLSFIRDARFSCTLRGRNFYAHPKKKEETQRKEFFLRKKQNTVKNAHNRLDNRK